MLFLFIGLLGILGISTPASKAFINGDIASYIDDYREGGISLGSRAQYGVELNTTNIFTVILTFPISLFYYMLAPFPWQISAIIDIYALADNFLRVILIIFAFKYLGNIEKEKKKSFIQLLTIFFILEILWSLGTVNWGTAIRHHLPAYGLILLLAVPNVVKSVNRITKSLQ